MEPKIENEPAGIDERPEQFRPPVQKADGVTESERYLAKLSEKSFLNLWSYPSPFRDQKKPSKGDGKELCDLLVVCGDDIIIFSEKTIEWPGKNVDTAWRRWASRAVESSAKQVRGAERWIMKFPDRIFLDRKCNIPFPIDLPQSHKRKIHKILVAQGATQACKEHLKEGSGSLIIRPDIIKEKHWSSSTDIIPFKIGDIDPSGTLIHVFDEISLNIILSELDTIRDFTDYLDKRQDFIRSGRLIEAQGEENLFAFYAVRVNSDGHHDFTDTDNNEKIFIDRGHYQKLIQDARYIAKKEEDKISYVWDNLIETFTNHMLDGTSIVLEGHEFELRKNEISVRYMAQQSRFARRAHGQAVIGALEKGKHSDRFFRTILFQEGSMDYGIAFFIQTLKYQEWMNQKGGYEKYRKKRTEGAVIYARGLLERYPHLERVIGVSREPPIKGNGVSEDLVYCEQVDWTNEERVSIQENCIAIGVLQGELKGEPWSGQEFPELLDINVGQVPSKKSAVILNRKQRRAMKSKKKKKV